LATRVFSDEELAQLRGFPEITRDELIRFFTLTSANRAFVDPGRGRSARDRLGLAVQLCTLPWLGFVPDELTGLLPFAPIASVLIELDRRTGFLDRFTHAGGAKPRSPELKRNLIAVLIAQATNLGLARTADACGIACDTLAWTQEWYVREETLRAANLALIDYHRQLPMTALFGSGTLSSSDGQRFPTKGKSITARALSRYFADEGLSTYTHLTDQHAVYGTKVIVATDREAPYVLDEILGNQTDLPINEHATDTHGASLLNFALFDLCGLQMSPRIRDLGKITLYRARGRAEVCAQFPVAGPLLTRRINFQLIAENWDEMLRLAASLKYGHVTASLIVAKLSRADRQNTLAAALKEYGALRRTIYAARYLARPDYRRKIGRQLNKGESMHALRRDVFYAHEGAIRRRHLQHQNDQAWCLTLAANAITRLDHRIPRSGCAAATLPRPAGRRHPAGAPVPGAVRNHRADRHHHRRHRPRTRPTRPHRPPRPSQAFRRDTSAMTAAADRLYERDAHPRGHGRRAGQRQTPRPPAQALGQAAGRTAAHARLRRLIHRRSGRTFHRVPAHRVPDPPAQPASPAR